MKKVWLISVLFITIALLVACGSDGGDKLAKLQDEGKVTIGFANEKPYAYEEDGELKGAAVDIAKAVFAELGVEEVESELLEFGQLISGINAGQFDVITAGMAIQPDRCENVAFGEPEMMYGEGLIVQQGNPLNLESYEDIANNPDTIIAVMQGATENEFLIDSGVDPSQILSVPDIPASIAAVQSGRADATTGTEMTIKDALASANTDELEFVETFEQPDVEGVPSYGAAAFNQEDTALVEAYNEVLADLKADGTVAELLEKNGFSEQMNMVPGDITTEKICNGEI
ncbi:ectoine/hydroxyectoine ABC transporter substrate-binding protein EhuB [Ornithinibacillus massiliensis]|uniref:Ectoine/hydroxyectoine ABC transporter substrate-binding protein EhuB n=1 Tax=Ornithinibacillus massiliensis TaxID=1944633 RepID=A0ABS5MGM0_9BACI|nr:ectoine/hydroxyectoine ABC transporter substrate-binding protein EhuB [Ornithinibacillus massiliensis]MBS3681489.1 ectoine/hydroxyectoine ABC transporter substrate-binding protein EhuB [Ornithinibacillus massiliensis]